MSKDKEGKVTGLSDGGMWLTCSFFSKHFVKVQVVQSYNSTDMTRA